MLHYSCDLCKRPLDPEDDLRYVVKIEVYAALDPNDTEAMDSDRDNLHELHEILERMDDTSHADVSEEVYQQQRYDLCPECRKKFLKNPLGRKTTGKFDFSKN